MLVTILIAVAYLYQLALAQGPPPSLDDGLACRPSGTCTPCPEDVLGQPYCQPFGNRRPVFCTNVSTIPPNQPYPDTHTSHSPPPNEDSFARIGEGQAWQSCGRIVSKERADFWEFVACNVLFATLSFILLFVRSKRMQALQARQLAARIGVIRGR